MPRDLPAPDPPPPRLSEGPLPPYRYVPGHHPHPVRHPAGHAWIGGGVPPEPPWSRCPWSDDPQWRRAVDLFNHRYYWEAHEVWEGIWRQLPPGDPLRELCQGLVQAAAAVLKRHLGHHEASATLLAASVRRLEAARAGGGEVVHGLRVAAVLDALDAWRDHGTWPLLTCEAPP